MTTKGIILAGGSGTRLGSITKAVSKQMLPVYDKPMIFYPLSVLLGAGIREILVITNQEYLESYRRLLGSGQVFGADIRYACQEKPRGLADAYLVAEEFLFTVGQKDYHNSVMILGDNLFFGQSVQHAFEFAVEQANGATILGCEVADPQNYGVATLTGNSYYKTCRIAEVISLEEKPSIPRSNYAVPGIYFLDRHAVRYAKQLKPSKRGELEITDLIKMYATIQICLLHSDTVWFDAGTPERLLDASNYVHAVQKRTKNPIGSPAIEAYKAGLIQVKPDVV